MADDDDDLLTIDDLPPCCAPGTGGLRLQIISLLMSDACQDMKFRVGGVFFNGFLYRSVANALRDPGHTLHIEVISNLSGGKDAEYDNRHIKVKFPLLDNGTDLAYKCGTLVHECTHACIDAQPGLQVWRSVNEIAGYFASFLWRRGQGYPMPDPGENNFVKTLCDLAVDARKANVRGDVFIMPDKAIDYLKRIIIGGYKLPRDFLEVGKGF